MLTVSSHHNEAPSRVLYVFLFASSLSLTMYMIYSPHPAAGPCAVRAPCVGHTLLKDS